MHFVKQVDKAGYPRAAELVCCKTDDHTPARYMCYLPLSKCDRYPIAK